MYATRLSVPTSTPPPTNGYQSPEETEVDPRVQIKHTTIGECSFRPRFAAPEISPQFRLCHVKHAIFRPYLICTTSAIHLHNICTTSAHSSTQHLLFFTLPGMERRVFQLHLLAISTPCSAPISHHLLHSTYCTAPIAQHLLPITCRFLWGTQRPPPNLLTTITTHPHHPHAWNAESSITICPPPTSHALQSPACHSSTIFATQCYSPFWLAGVKHQPLAPALTSSHRLDHHLAS